MRSFAYHIPERRVVRVISRGAHASIVIEIGRGVRPIEKILNGALIPLDTTPAWWSGSETGNRK